ncbi:type II toxin-antitoxin system VapC family toxin [Paludisphaera borealis]|uniref:23S rRNA-specific endonuclease VapC20 n=1 Tax=Paludisphaera borealis TaxID=1387353 RepID=A0A1U7CIC5_9BACT|nr:PIN domain-containing protein [Paludisphaera borealis]APW58656.1 23S rRNA-specific endonuclease VapC20 [Paludisphaera borealis]
MNPNTAFLDTAGLIAVWNADDQWHPLAKPVFAGLVRSKSSLLTTSLVLMECANTAARRPFRNDVILLRDRLKTARMLIDPTEDDLEQAWRAYARGEAGQAGIVDHVSFVVMRRLGLTQAFTNDAHFRAAGFVTLF